MKLNTKVTVRSAAGEVLVELQGRQVLPGLATHRAISGITYPGWVVTHLPTGWRIFSARTLTEVTKTLDLLRGLDWTFEREVNANEEHKRVTLEARRRLELPEGR